MSKKGRKVGLLIILSILIAALGAGLYLLPRFGIVTEGILLLVCSYGGLGLSALGGLLFIIAIFVAIFGKKKKEEPIEVVEHAPIETPPADQTVTPEVFMPSENPYNFVYMGERQSREEKFNEIGRMDKTQFIIYVARLFSRKGYQVKFTPVVDNYNIDLLVEKMGVSIAIGVILTNKVLCESDIRCVVEGSKHYQCQNVMTLTNMYFDRTSLEYAKRERMSLVDRNILAEDFM